MMIDGIEYKKAELDTESVELLRKLDQQNFPLDSLIIEVQKKFADLVKVYYDKKCYGLLVVRGVRLHCGDLCIIIDHAVAEDAIEEHFSAILARSLWEWVANQTFNGENFKHVHQHANSPALARMCEKEYGKPGEWIFKKDVREFKNDASNVQLRSPSLESAKLEG